MAATVPGSRWDFAAGVADQIGAPVDRPDDPSQPSDAVRFIIAWAQLEGGDNNNPLNIGPGRTYGTIGDGIRATAHELGGSIFYVIRDALKSNDLGRMVAAVQSVPWCFENGQICPGYGVRIRSIVETHKGNNAAFLASANKVVGTPANPASPNSTFAITGQSSSSAEGQANDIKLPGEGIVTSTADVLKALGNIAAFLLDPSNWKRGGLILGGAALIGVGVAIVNRDTLTDAAGKAAKVAALA